METTVRISNTPKSNNFRKATHIKLPKKVQRNVEKYDKRDKG